MDNFVIAEIESAQKKMGSYIALLNYRYINLCVKANIGSLLPVTVLADYKECNLEDVASVNQPDEFKLGVYPKDPSYRKPIIEGIYEAHPEFKMEIKNSGDSEDERQEYLLYTMPDVDKNRRDFLMDAVKGLSKECDACIEKVYAKYQARFAEMFVNSPAEEAEEANMSLKNTRNKCLDMAEDLLIKKENEIEDGYTRYLNEGGSAEAASDGMDVSHAMKLNFEGDAQ